MLCRTLAGLRGCQTQVLVSKGFALSGVDIGSLYKGVHASWMSDGRAVLQGSRVAAMEYGIGVADSRTIASECWLRHVFPIETYLDEGVGFGPFPLPSIRGAVVDLLVICNNHGGYCYSGDREDLL